MPFNVQNTPTICVEYPIAYHCRPISSTKQRKNCVLTLKYLDSTTIWFTYLSIIILINSLSMERNDVEGRS